LASADRAHAPDIEALRHIPAREKRSIAIARRGTRVAQHGSMSFHFFASRVESKLPSRFVARSLALSALLLAAACGSSSTKEAPPIGVPDADAPDAATPDAATPDALAACAMSVQPNDDVIVDMQYGFNSFGCSGSETNDALLSHVIYHLDLASGSLHLDATRLLRCDVTRKPISSSKETVLDDGQRAALLAALGAMVTERSTAEMADWGYGSVKLTHAGGAVETLVANSAEDQMIGSCGIRESDFESVVAKLKTILPP
jgi:hypothetical protein